MIGERQTLQGDYIHRLAIDLRKGRDPVKTDKVAAIIHNGDQWPVYRCRASRWPTHRSKPSNSAGSFLLYLCIGWQFSDFDTFVLRVLT
jgi:hypothetical protein